jgi:hypothetical protein
MIVGVTGVVKDDGGMIVVVINVGFDANRFPARCGDFVRGIDRTHGSATEKGNNIFASWTGNRACRRALMNHAMLGNACRCTWRFRISSDKLQGVRPVGNEV